MGIDTSRAFDGAEEVRRAFAMRFGSIEIIVQDGRVVRIKEHVTHDPRDPHDGVTLTRLEEVDG